MHWISLGLALSLLTQPASSVRPPDRTALHGTWSGDWMPNGIWQAITIELSEDKPGVLTGRFVTRPSPIAFSKVSFDGKTSAIVIDANDQTSGKEYHLVGKV